MSLRPEPIRPVPEGTVRVARAAFPKGTTYTRMRDELGVVWEDEDFGGLFSKRGQPALAPWRLVLVTVMQFAEGLSDRQAADAVRSRIDWKYALSLELEDPGFDFSVLSEFRARMLAGGVEHLLLEKLLAECKDRGLLKARGKQRTDSTHVLAAVKAMGRLECIGETLRAALNVLATVAPGWLRSRAPHEWFERYGPRVEEFRLPRGDAERKELAEQIGADGFDLLRAVEAEDAPARLNELEAVNVLRRVWSEQYHPPQEPGGRARLRETKEMRPAAETIQSPYDTEARYSWKREVNWVGYKVHLTETCEEGSPNLITHVETMPSTSPDLRALAAVHESLSEKDLLPDKQLVDAGYMGSMEMTAARNRHGVDLFGPMPRDGIWQAKTPGGIDSTRFRIDWDAREATCPEGKKSRYWKPALNRHGRDVVAVLFDKAVCGACESRPLCTRSKFTGRELTLRPQPQHEVLLEARKRQLTREFWEAYHARAGVEGTVSQGVRVFGLRRSRYVGTAKTHLQHVITAVAMNVVRLLAWFAGVPKAQTRLSAFARLAPEGC
ncbi:MAG: IS1182 family transposase [Actinomycetota bacterium]|nr:IS1182 family transposase [Actinomycetota bacterium]